MGEGKTAKYFQYAIGEIILVVIGILIALQINDWSQERKNRSFEADMLSQIHTNLTIDRENLIIYSRNGHNAMASIGKILNTQISESNKDSLYSWLGDIIQFDRFQPLTNAYEVLKSKGLDQVSNRELRLLLGTYYEGKAKEIEKSLGDIELTFNQDWLPLLKKHVLEMKFKNFIKIDDLDLFNNPGENRNLLIMNVDNYSGSVEDIDEGIVLITRLQDIIKRELNFAEQE